MKPATKLSRKFARLDRIAAASGMTDAAKARRLMRQLKARRLQETS